MLEIVSGAVAKTLIDYSDAIAITRDLFMAMDRGEAVAFPSIRGHGSNPSGRFGVKAGYLGDRNLPGLKVGSYWPGNNAWSLPNHGSTTLLLDDNTGFPVALVEATWLNGLRTAASDAVAADTLARKDASVLAVIGTGTQAYHDVRAVALVRSLSEILVAGRSEDSSRLLVDRLVSDGLPARVSGIDVAVSSADILVTVTGARAPLFDAPTVRMGTHISAMGADGPGKQELPPALADRASLFADVVEQSLDIGEFQYLVGTQAARRICGIGAVLNDSVNGRTMDSEITIYDSSGIGTQDLAIAALVLDRARAKGLVTTVEF